MCKNMTFQPVIQNFTTSVDHQWSQKFAYALVIILNAIWALKTYFRSTYLILEKSPKTHLISKITSFWSPDGKFTTVVYPFLIVTWNIGISASVDVFWVHIDSQTFSRDFLEILKNRENQLKNELFLPLDLIFRHIHNMTRTKRGDVCTSYATSNTIADPHCVILTK